MASREEEKGTKQIEIPVTAIAPLFRALQRLEQGNSLNDIYQTKQDARLMNDFLQLGRGCSFFIK